MNDNLDLDQRIRDLAAAVPPPATPLEQDLARGRGRLRRTRFLATGGAVAGVAAIALGIGLTGAALDTRDAAPNGPASQGVEPAPPKQKAAPDDRTGGELLRDYRNVLAEHVDPNGTHLQKKPDNLQSGGGLGTKLGWSVPGESGLGMLEIFVGDGWGGVVGELCGDGVECTQQDVDGIHATVARSEGVTSVLVKRADGSNVLLTANLLFGNNSLVPVSGMDISVEDLIRAAGDLRLVEATPEQIRNAGESMGFPDHPEFFGPLEKGESEVPVPPQG